jgi:hypothetical protein
MGGTQARPVMKFSVPEIRLAIAVRSASLMCAHGVRELCCFYQEGQ